MGLICEKRDEEYYSFTIKEVCDLLNELYETTQYWSNKLHKEVDKNIELQNENDKLKQKIKSKDRVIQAYEQYINDLKEDGVIWND